MGLTEQLAFQGLNGLTWGLILALMALGLSLIYGVLRIINVAHGALYTVGAVLAWALTPLVGFSAALALAAFGVGLLGALLELAVLRPVEEKPVLTIIITFGLLLVLEHLILLSLGGAPRALPLPRALQFSIPLFGLRYPGYRVVVAGLALLASGGLWLVLHRTRLGLQVRAIAQSRELARALGLPVRKVYALTFGLGAALAGLAGALTAPLISVSYRMGEPVLVTAFIVVIVGGLGSLGGALLASIAFGLLTGLFAIWTTPTLAQVLALAALGLPLLFCPEGLIPRSRSRSRGLVPTGS